VVPRPTYLRSHVCSFFVCFLFFVFCLLFVVCCLFFFFFFFFVVSTFYLLRGTGATTDFQRNAEKIGNVATSHLLIALPTLDLQKVLRFLLSLFLLYVNFIFKILSRRMPLRGFPCRSAAMSHVL